MMCLLTEEFTSYLLSCRIFLTAIWVIYTERLLVNYYRIEDSIFHIHIQV